MSAALQLPLTLHSRDYYDHSSVTATLYVYMGNCDSATMFQEIRIPKYLSQERERGGGRERGNFTIDTYPSENEPRLSLDAAYMSVYLCLTPSKLT